MTSKKNPRPKQSSGPITFKVGYADVAATVAKQKAWAYEIAAGIERGLLPAAEGERQTVAMMIRHVADQMRAPEAPKKAGNPSFERKLPDDDSVAVAVRYRIAFGDEPSAAIAHVAGSFDVDESTVGKIFRVRRDAVANFFLNSNLAHRVGAIRGE